MLKYINYTQLSAILFSISEAQIEFEYILGLLVSTEFKNNLNNALLAVINNNNKEPITYSQFATLFADSLKTYSYHAYKMVYKDSATTDEINTGVLQVLQDLFAPRI